MAAPGGRGGAHFPGRITGRRRTPVPVLAVTFGALAAYGVALLVAGRSAGFTASDTLNLVAGARLALSCLSHHHWQRCGFPNNVGIATPGRTSKVAPYALLQYLPAAFMIKLGLTNHQVREGLLTLNSVSLVATVAVVGVVGRRALGRGWGCLLMAVVVAGPLAFYAVSGFGEMFATFVVTLAIAAAALRRPVLLGGAMAAACLGKETFAPFLIVLALVAGRERTDGLLPAARLLVPAVAGAAAGVVVDGAFNLLRFGTIVNRTYLDPLFVVPGVGRRVSYSLAMWVSPNAGLLWFWPPAVVLLGAVVVTTGVSALRGHQRPRAWLPVLVTLAVISVFTWGLGSFVAPFGWVAWGPRLLLPLVPAVLVTAVTAAPRSAVAGIGRALRSGAGLAVGALLLAVTAVTQVGAVWNFGPAYRRMSTPDALCSSPPVIVQVNATGYYRCLTHMAWRTDQLALVEAVRAGGAAPHTAQAALLLGGLGLFLLGVRELPSPRSTRGGGRASRR